MAITTNDSNRARLAELVNELAVVRGKVTLASGLESNFYVDMRRATLHHEAAPLIGHVMLDLLEENGFSVDEVDAVGGLTMGADPVATAMLHAAAARGLDLDAFVVRKAAKDHGMKRQIEGPSVEGKRVVVLEDTSTTGGSPIQAVEALRAAGAQVLAVAVIVDRNTGARERIEAADLPYLYALGLEDLDLEKYWPLGGRWVLTTQRPPRLPPKPGQAKLEVGAQSQGGTMDSNPTGTIALFIGGGLLLLLWVSIIVVARVQVRSLGERLDHNWSDVEETLSRRHRRAKKLAREADKLGALAPGDMSALNEAIALAEQENQPLLRANYEDDITLILRRIVESVRAVNRNKEREYRLAYKRLKKADKAVAKARRDYNAMVPTYNFLCHGPLTAVARSAGRASSQYFLADKLKRKGTYKKPKDAKVLELEDKA